MRWSTFEVMEIIRAEMLALLDQCGQPGVATSYAGIGVTAWDDPCNGQLTVTPVRRFRSAQFPQEYLGEEQCFDLMIAWEISVLLLRCVPTPDDMGRPPTAAKLQTAHESAIMDSDVMWKMIATHDFPEDWEIANPSASYGGSEGGAVGMELTFILGIPAAQWDCPDCPPI